MESHTRLDAERLRVADELHSTVAQHLTHLRLELSHLATHGFDTAAMRCEAGHLAAVAAAALADIRRTIYVLNGLSTPDHLFARIAAIVGEAGEVRPREVVYLREHHENEVLGFVRRTVEGLIGLGASRCDVDIDGGAGSVTVRITNDLNAEADHILTIEDEAA